jgi:hypothetical protein
MSPISPQLRRRSKASAPDVGKPWLIDLGTNCCTSVRRARDRSDQCLRSAARRAGTRSVVAQTVSAFPAKRRPRFFSLAKTGFDLSPDGRGGIFVLPQPELGPGKFTGQNGQAQRNDDDRRPGQHDERHADEDHREPDDENYNSFGGSIQSSSPGAEALVRENRQSTWRTFRRSYRYHQTWRRRATETTTE